MFWSVVVVILTILLSVFVRAAYRIGSQIGGDVSWLPGGQNDDDEWTDTLVEGTAAEVIDWDG
jgi:hypothetical protein